MGNPRAGEQTGSFIYRYQSLRSLFVKKWPLQDTHKRAVSYLAENLWILFPTHSVTLCFFTYTNIHKLVTLSIFMKTIYMGLCIYDYIYIMSLCIAYMNDIFYVYIYIYASIYDLTVVCRACAMSSLITKNISMRWNGVNHETLLNGVVHWSNF